MSIAIEDIKDHESLIGWLEAFPETDQAKRQAAVFVAARAAARVLSLAWEFHVYQTAERKADFSAFPILGSVLKSGVAAKMPTLDVRAFADGVVVGASMVSVEEFSVHSAAFAAVNVLYAAYNIDSAGIDAFLAAETAEAAANSVAAATIWNNIRKDCAQVEKHDDANRFSVFAGGLWDGDENPLSQDWAELKSKLGAETDVDWSFWINWYDDLLQGREPNWDMLHEVATSKAIDWKASSAEVNAAIGVIVDTYKPKADIAEKLLAEKLLQAAIADYKFDDIQRLMRMVPFAKDVKTLEDEATLASFLAAADLLREDMELFCTALAAEGAAVQGAGTVRIYVDAILEELSKARQTQVLRVGRIVDLGAVLQTAAFDDATRREFGPILTQSLDNTVKGLTDLTRDYFAPTLLRFAPLNEFELESGTNAWEYLNETKGVLANIESGKFEGMKPLAPEDLAVFKDLAKEVERAMRQPDNGDGPVAQSWQKEINYRLALLNVSVLLYGIRAKQVAKTLDGGLNVLIDKVRKATTLGMLWDIIKEIFK